MNKIEWKKKAFKQLRKIDRSQQAVILVAVGALIDWPNTSNVKKLTNHIYPYRLRVGDYRVFFSVVQGQIHIITIEEVKKRNERTY
jgi:mRNA interferase RelE/StbE